MSTVEQRRRTRARLKRVGNALDALRVRLEAIHADRSGGARMFYATPLIPAEAAPFARSVKRITADAVNGCDLSAAWLEKTRAQREATDRLRGTSPPERSPDYAGPCLPPSLIMHLGKASKRTGIIDRRPPEEIVAEGRERIRRQLHAREERERARREGHDPLSFSGPLDGP